MGSGFFLVIRPWKLYFLKIFLTVSGLAGLFNCCSVFRVNLTSLVLWLQIFFFTNHLSSCSVECLERPVFGLFSIEFIFCYSEKLLCTVIHSIYLHSFNLLTFKISPVCFTDLPRFQCRMMFSYVNRNLIFGLILMMLLVYLKLMFSKFKILLAIVVEEVIPKLATYTYFPQYPKI